MNRTYFQCVQCEVQRRRIAAAGAKKEVDAALSRKPRLSDELDALKSAIDRAIPAVEGRGKEAEARVAELQTRIGAIKVNSFAQ